MIKIYLDTCSLNRPFDDQDFTKVRLETEAIHLIKSGIYGGRYPLSWSFMLDYEINESPFDKRLDSIIEWKGLSLDFCKSLSQ